MTIKVFEAFSGVGAQRMALRNLGLKHEVVAIAEIDKYALKSYEAIHGDCPNVGDISKLNVEDIPDHDLFTYSFPCQDISIAGNQRGLDEGTETRSSLLWECKKIIEGKKPKYLLMENVKNLVGKKHRHNFDKWLEYLQDLGYTNYWEVLNAKDYNVPQNRERVFVVSILGEHSSYEFPKAIPLEKVVRDIIDDEVDEKYYSNKPFKFVNKGKVKAEFLEGNFDQGKRIHGLDTYFQTLGAAERGTNNILVENKKTVDFSQANHLSGGELRKHLVRQGIKRTTDYRVRKLTPKECWRLMGFCDEDFNKAKAAGVSDTQLCKQAGNSIVVPVLEGIFEQLFKKAK